MPAASSPAVACLCRGARKRFSIIGRSGRPEPIGLPVHRVKPREVALLAYSSMVVGMLVPGAVGGTEVRVGDVQALVRGQSEQRAAAEAVGARAEAVTAALSLGSSYFMAGPHQHLSYVDVVFDHSADVECYLMMFEDERAIPPGDVVSGDTYFLAGSDEGAAPDWADPVYRKYMPRQLAEFVQFAALVRRHGIRREELVEERARQRAAPDREGSRKPANAKAQWSTSRARAAGPVVASKPVASERKSGLGLGFDALFGRAAQATAVGGGVVQVGRAVMPKLASRSGGTARSVRGAASSSLPTAMLGQRALDDAAGAVSGVAVEARSIADTLLYRKLRERPLGDGVVGAVCAELQLRFGDQLAIELADEEWFVDLEAWKNFAGEVHVRLQTCGGGFEEVHVSQQIQSVLFRVFRTVVTHQREDDRVLQLYNATTDRQKLAELEQQGWTHVRASGAGCNCLADSLLELLMGAGLVRRDVDRIEACRANREQLEQTPALQPRDSQGVPSHVAYLEHSRHAGPAILYFVGRYSRLEELPRAGVQVVVHARYDGEAPPDSIIVCEGCSERSGPPLAFHLFNWTGRGFDGYHYDALIPGNEVPLMALPASDDEVLSDVGDADVDEAMRRSLAMVPSPYDGRADRAFNDSACSFGVDTLEEDEVVRRSLDTLSVTGDGCGGIYLVWCECEGLHGMNVYSGMGLIL